MGSVEFLTLARKVADGDHVDDPRVRYLQASSITIEFPNPSRLFVTIVVPPARPLL